MGNLPGVDFLRSIKRGIQVLRGFDCFFKPDMIMDYTRFGSAYGGWNVPVNMLNEGSIVYSAGIGTDISFDLELIDQFNLEIHAFDPTPKSIEWLNGQDLPPGFHCHPWGLADHDGTAAFHTPRNPSHVSHSVVQSQVTTEEAVKVRVRRIKSIMEELNHSHVDLLKMDIEGSEYSVISDLLASSIRPTLLLVEFHHRFKSIGAATTKKAVRTLKENDYALYSISKSGEELCFAAQPPS